MTCSLWRRSPIFRLVQTCANRLLYLWQLMDKRLPRGLFRALHDATIVLKLQNEYGGALLTEVLLCMTGLEA